MRIELRAGTVAAFTLSTALLPWTAASAADAKEATHPTLSGRWELVPDKSDDPGQAADFLMSPPQARLFPGGGGPPLGGGPGFPGVGRGGRGRFGGAGWGRGAHGGLAGELVQSSPEERAAMREAVENAIQAAATMDVVENGPELTIHLPEGQRRHFTTDGKKNVVYRVVEQARWKKDRLELRTETRLLKIRETWSIGPEPDQLSVETRAKRLDTDGELVLRRVYQKAAAAAPAPAAPVTAPAAEASAESGT